MTPPRDRDEGSRGAEMRRLEENIKHVADDVAEIKRMVESKYVTQDQFWPVKTIAYGLVTFILLGFMTALAALIYHK